MDDPAQALAYAEADFSEPHNQFIRLLRERLGSALTGTVLDLGCGPADICIRFARAFPACIIHGMEGANSMLALGAQAVLKAKLEQRIKLVQGYLPDALPPQADYDLITSNSLLHHLADPATLWESIKRYAAPDSAIFIMDLLRPDSEQSTQALVTTYARGEPEILRRDFYNSLRAAYTEEEIRQQLRDAHLDRLSPEIVSDRHWIVSGRLSV